MRANLKIASNNRRSDHRSKYKVVISSINLNGIDETTSGVVLDASPGVLNLELENIPTDIKVDDEIDITLKDLMGRKIIDGIWILRSKNIEKKILRLERKEMASLREYREIIDPRAFYKTSGYRILNETENKKEFDELFTSLKEYSNYIPVQLEDSDYTKKKISRFSFDDGFKTLETIFLESSDHFEIGSTVQVRFTLFSYEHIFFSNVVNWHSDFSILELSIPKTIISFGSRVFVRDSMNIDAFISSEGNDEIPVVLKSLSIGGGDCELKHSWEGPLETGLSLNIAGTILEIGILEVINKKVRFYFVETKENLLLARRTSIAVSKKNLVIRDPKNFSLFEELYRKIGYERKTEDWKNLSEKAWSIQDEYFPQGTLGGGLTEELTMTTGTIPFSKACLYCHSIGLVKNESSILFLFDGIIRGLDFFWVYPEYEYFLGAFMKSSRFTRGLFLTYGHICSPPNNILINNLVVRLDALTSKANSKFELRIPVVKNALPKVAVFFEQSSERIPGHNIVVNEILCEKNVIAWVFKFNSQRFSTANDVLNFTWVLVKDEFDQGSNIYDLLSHLGTVIKDSSTCFSVFREDLSVLKSIQFDKTFRDSFWTVTEFDEVLPVVSSVSRSCLRVIRKYGIEANPKCEL
ncbi:MAG: hypothetical protein AB7F43_04205 [Bacteriovoracia bacterium]